MTSFLPIHLRPDVDVAIAPEVVGVTVSFRGPDGGTVALWMTRETFDRLRDAAEAQR